MRVNNIHRRRLYIISFIAIGVTISACLILYALRQNIDVYFTPSQLAATSYSADQHIRLGGMVKKGSLVRSSTSLEMQFTVTDFKQELVVHYTGILPDLFREGKGVIAEGYLNAQHQFVATQVLAKHDENYAPKIRGQQIS